MIYNDKLCINETNQESVLTVLQVKNWLSIQNTLLTRSCLL